MHPEMYLSLQRELERERDARLASRRSPATPTADDGARLRSRLTRAVATVRAAATPSTCCALA